LVFLKFLNHKVREQLKVQGGKLRVFKVRGSISKMVEVQGGSLKFPKKKKKKKKKEERIQE
jgi:hypothetical protein